MMTSISFSIYRVRSSLLKAGNSAEKHFLGCDIEVTIAGWSFGVHNLYSHLYFCFSSLQNGEPSFSVVCNFKQMKRRNRAGHIALHLITCVAFTEDQSLVDNSLWLQSRLPNTLASANTFIYVHIPSSHIYA